jgi:hypothetical protein
MDCAGYFSRNLRHRQLSMNLTRKIIFTPAWDKTDPDPSKNCGVHGMELIFTLSGPEGGVTFTIYTNWMLPHVQAKHDELLPGYIKAGDDWLSERPKTHNMMHLFHKPQPATITYHSKKPTYDGQKSTQNDCKITGGPCYCDGSGLAAQELFTKFVAEGEDAVWRELTEWYTDKLLNPPT